MTTPQEPYTPTTAAIRKVYVAAPIVTERNRLNDSDIANNDAAFSRWLAAHDAAVRDAQREADVAIVNQRDPYIARQALAAAIRAQKEQS